MGVVRSLALGALCIAIFLFGLTAGLFLEVVQQSREEYVLGEASSTELLPADRITREDISVYNDHVKILIPGVHWATFTATGSMLPVLGSTVHALQIEPQPGGIRIGDIVSIRVDGKVVSHRVISIGQDVHGTYYITKGDSNPVPDPEPVRFEQIDRVLVGILY